MAKRSKVFGNAGGLRGRKAFDWCMMVKPGFDRTARCILQAQEPGVVGARLPASHFVHGHVELIVQSRGFAAQDGP